MSDKTRLYELYFSYGNNDSRPIETAQLMPEKAAELNAIFKKDKSNMRWIDDETGKAPGEPENEKVKPGDYGHERILTDTDVANEKILELFTDRPAEFILALQRMMGQASYDVFIIWEKYRAAIHNPQVPGNLIIQEPQRPEDIPIMKEMSQILMIFTNDKMLDDCLKVAEPGLPGKDMPEMKWSDKKDGKRNTGNSRN